jgi:RHS repeat-associated protein
MRYFYGIRSTDDIVLRRQTVLATSAVTEYYHLTDALFSTVAVMGANKAILERVEYTAYGMAYGHQMPDVNGDRQVNIDDLLAVQGNWGNYGYGDLTHDGVVNIDDLLAVIGAWGQVAPQVGRISAAGSSGGTDNIFGFTGQIYNAEVGIQGAYLYRMRWYDPELGRFFSRDPAGYIDGMLLYAYVSGNPMVMVDPLGLSIWSWLFGEDTSSIKAHYDNLAAKTEDQYKRGAISKEKCEADKADFAMRGRAASASSEHTFDVAAGEVTHDRALGYADTAYEHTVGNVDILGLAKPDFESGAYNAEDFQAGKTYSEWVATTTEVVVAGGVDVWCPQGSKGTRGARDEGHRRRTGRTSSKTRG